jgi:putative DNA primase/helicase
MSTGALDFKGLNQAALSRVRELLTEWLPGGRAMGREYCCGSLRGEEGQSLKVNMESGVWKDFATDESGGDLVSLLAAIEGIGQGESAKRIADRIGYRLDGKLPLNSTSRAEAASPPAQQASASSPIDPRLGPPPSDVAAPSMAHPVHGKPSQSWSYRDAKGAVLFYVARYEGKSPTERKQIIPWSWDQADLKWIPKAWPAPRPLYGLDLLDRRPAAPVLIVEGEKACDAARSLIGETYVCVSWSGGSQAYAKTDWTPVFGRKILMWPDADEPGVKAMRGIAEILDGQCTEIKIIDLSPRDAFTTVPGFDAADALDLGWTKKDFIEWAKPRARVYTPTPAVTPEVLPAETEPAELAGRPVHVTVEQVDAEGEAKLPESVLQIYQRLGVACNDRNQPFNNIDNVNRILEGLPEYKDFVWWDEFHKKYLTRWRAGVIREWTDIDDLKLARKFQREYGFHRMSDEVISKGIRDYAEEHKRNEPRDWLESLTWDGVERVQHFFEDAMDTAYNEYTSAAAKNWWISMVARIYRPGCKVDSMIILEGAQGKYKSTALNIIGGPWYAEAHESVTSKDFYMLLQGKLLVEISELDAFSKAEVNTIKKVITCQSDRFRPPYERSTQDFPRQCVFVGTTNEDAYLRDTTGGRRFWPIRIEEINLDYISKQRDQFFAEAVHLFKAGHTWHEMPADRTALEQESRRQYDEWESIIQEYLIGQGEITVAEIGKGALDIDAGKLDQPLQRRISKILRQLGWRNATLKRGGKTVRRWVKEIPGYIATDVSRNHDVTKNH